MSSTTTAPVEVDATLGEAVPVWRAYLPVLLAAIPLALLPLFLGDSRTYMGIITGLLVAAGYAAGFNVIFGMTGQLFLSIGAIGGVGGYACAILADRVGLPVVVAILAGTLLASALGALFSWVSVRRSLDVIFTGIVTLTFSLGFENLLLGQREFTGGEDGMRVEAGQDLFIGELVPGYYAILVAVVGFLVLFRFLERSHYGWAFRALKDDETTAELAGVNVSRYRIHAGAIGSAMVGLTGALYALNEGRVTPTAFEFAGVDVSSLVILAFGGLGTLLAPVVGSVFFALLEEFVLRDLGTLRIAVYGLILTGLFLFFRDGLAGLVDRLRGRGHDGPVGPV